MEHGGPTQDNGGPSPTQDGETMKPLIARYSLSDLYPFPGSPPVLSRHPGPGRGGYRGHPVLFVVCHPDPFGLEGEDRSLGRFMRDLDDWGFDVYPGPRGQSVGALPLEAVLPVSSSVRPGQVLDQVSGLALVDVPDQVNATDGAEPLFHAAPDGAGPLIYTLETSAQKRARVRRLGRLTEIVDDLSPECAKRVRALRNAGRAG